MLQLSACGRSAIYSIDVVDAAVVPARSGTDMAADDAIDMREHRDMERHHHDLATAFDFAMTPDLSPSRDLTLWQDLAQGVADLGPSLDLSVPSDVTQGVLVTTFAGSGVSGDLDGPAESATFKCPVGIAVDSVGIVYVSDFGGNVIRKITRDRVVSTLAGNGLAGSADGPGLTAEFHWPAGIALNNAGDLLVADSQNNRIRKVASDGTTSTVAGNGIFGHVDGSAATAEFMNPISIGVTNAIYVGDGSATIRKITFDGTVSTFSGSGISGTVDGHAFGAEYVQVQGFAAVGNTLLITDVTAIRSVATDGTVTTLYRLLSGYADGILADNQGFIYFSTYGTGGNQVLEFPTVGPASVVAGAGSAGFADGPGSVALFNFPEGIASRTHGDILVADCDNHRIREITF